jgi:hypothetical protein
MTRIRVEKQYKGKMFDGPYIEVDTPLRKAVRLGISCTGPRGTKGNVVELTKTEALELSALLKDVAEKRANKKGR